ncbi:hypothetical protein EV359DRAFT_88233 [Lentinula novae-zelandiae]|nr:hypothetical protein EV359DRAFT_88233 [Lentinula novae-zelandiae]
MSVILFHRRCDDDTCLYPFAGTTKANHRAEYHSLGHGFIYLGTLVRVNRRSDGKIPCPCGLESHSRYSFKKLTALNKQNPHPGPEALEWSDHPPNVQQNPQPIPRLSPPTPFPQHIEPAANASSHEPQSGSQNYSAGQIEPSPPQNNLADSGATHEGSQPVLEADGNGGSMELGAEVNVEADVEMTDGIGEVGGGPGIWGIRQIIFVCSE